MKTRNLYLWVIIIILGVFLVACAKSTSSDLPATTPNSTEVIATLQKYANATVTAMAHSTVIPIVSTPTIPVPTETLVPVIKSELDLTVDLNVPANYFPIYDDNGELKAISYALNMPGPHVVEYPYQSTLIWASGKFTLAGDLSTVFVGKFGFAEDIGDIIFDVCQKESGCKAGSIGMTAGHAMVTIIFGGYENPKDSLAWAINNMFYPKSGNCGSGCKKVFVGEMQKGAVIEYTEVVEAGKLTYAVVPESPYAKVSLVGPNVPAGASVITDKDQPIGHVYYLTDKDAFVSVNEAGGTVIYCGVKCTIGSTEFIAGTAISFTGSPTDGTTPKDLNYTIHIKSSDPSMIRVYLIYSGSFEAQVLLLKEQYIDWTWAN